MKKIIIIGAGISGLTTGIYALKNGYDVEIYEKHSIAGGECTGWNRGKYYFDGCIHWLMGSKKGSSLNKLWREVGALDDSVNIINSQHFGEFQLQQRKLTLYRDIDRLEEHLIQISPVDEKEIRKMCKAIRGLKGMEIPFEKPFDMMGIKDSLKLGLEMLPYATYMKYGKISVEELADKFQNPLIKIAITEAIPSNYSALALLSSMASMAKGDSGWPEGGSRAFAQRIQKKFEEMGGNISFKSPVKKIVVEDNVAKGIELLDGNKIYADHIISATDGYETLYKLLSGNYLSDIHHKMYTATKENPVNSSFQVWVGVAADLTNESEGISFELPDTVEIGGGNYTRVSLKNYSYDKTIAPEGHSVITAFFMTTNFEWWSNLYKDKERYKLEKEHIAKVVKDSIEKHYPSTIGKIEEIDVATPMTYVRYCNAWRGAWMSWPTSPNLKVRNMPMKLEKLSNFIMAGQWVMPPGGLPVALLSGRWAIQHICNIDNKPFLSE